ncbi:MAG: MBL fold metallo-hydrolase [Bacteroidota bacterium]
MIRIQTFVFNHIEVNTYVVSAPNNDCVIIDPGCYGLVEEKKLDDYVAQNKLNVVKLLLTHGHIDHIVGIAHVEDTYKTPAFMHTDGADFLRASVGYASVFGFELQRVVKPGGFLTDNEVIRFGDIDMKVVHTPGHAAGSVCFVCEAEKLLFTGDVLFCDSIGRTDLPTGDYDVLMHSIKTKLFTLSDNFTVYPGHGSTTSIGCERENNPFIR